jgi:hypothetical protein
MAKIEFYNVKKRKKVQIDEKDVQKIKYQRKTTSGETQVRFAVKAVDDDKTNLTKFMSKADWEKLSAPEAKASVKEAKAAKK